MNAIFYIVAGLVWFLPAAVAFVPVVVCENVIIKVFAAGLAPLLFAVSFVLTAGILSKIGQKAIVPGKFPRDPKHPIYGARRVFGLCWTAVYYFKPLYWLMLQIPLLKKLTLRIFGYKGPTAFTVYPDTWIRDLPILELGEGCYLSNRATIGTNICLADGTVLVDRVRIGEKAMVGHLSMVAPGSRIDKKSEIGVGVAIGIRSKLLEDSKVKPSSSLNHGCAIGTNSEVGPHSYIGLRTIIRSNIRVPGGSVIPSGSIVNTQSELDALIGTEEGSLSLKLQQVLKDLSTTELSNVS